MSLRVGMDISQTAHGGGVSTYTKNLAKNLIKEKDLEMVFFFSSLRKKYQGKLPNVKNFKLPPTLFEVLFNKMRNVPIERFLGPMDIYHSSDWVQPPTKAKKVTTIHDLVPFLYPQWSDPKIVGVNKRRIKLVEKEVDMVIAVSHATKKDLVSVTKIPEEKIVVIYEGVDEIYKPQAEKEIKAFREKYNLPSNFILSIGGVGERRNLKKIKEAVGKYSLVVTGQDLPFIPIEQMPLLYAAADLLLYPSLYEGFGLPILEAQAVGTPVVTSSVSSMPEIAGEGALLVNPDSLEEIKEAVKKVLEDKTTKKDLIKKGFLNSKKYTWEKCASETAKVYRKLAL